MADAGRNDRETLPCRNLWRLTGACIAGFLTLLPIQASVAMDLYAGGDLAYTRAPVSGRDYNSYALKLLIGATHASGWGLELQGLAGLGDDSVAGIKIGLDSTLAAFVRYEYPKSADFRLYALAGYAWTSLSIFGEGTGGLDDSLGDFAYGVGMQEKLKRWKNTTAILEFNNYYSDSNVDIWSISAGLRYEF